MDEEVLTFSSTIVASNVLWVELYSLLRGLSLSIHFEYKKLRITMGSKVGVDIILSKCCNPRRALSITKKISTSLSMLEELELSNAWKETNQPTDMLPFSSTSPNEKNFHPNKFLVIFKDVILRDAFSCIYTRL